jgi:hypothetical protein
MDQRYKCNITLRLNYEIKVEYCLQENGMKDERIHSLLHCGTRRDLSYHRTVYFSAYCGKLSSSECHLYITQVYCNDVRSIFYLSKQINVWYERNFLYVWFSGRSNTVKISIKHIEDCIVIQVLSLSFCLSLTHTHTQNMGSVNVVLSVPIRQNFYLMFLCKRKHTF